jgi:RNA polymerase sigma-70 factor (ECF subfamily)
LVLFLAAIEDEDSRNFMVQLYLEYEAPMFRTAMGILHHQQDVEDVVQTTCLALSKKVPLLQTMDCCTLHSYVVISIRNTAINLIRKRERQQELLYGDDNTLAGLTRGNTMEDDQFMAFARRDALKQVIGKLPLRDRTLLEMKYILEQSDAEIARVIQVKPNGVRNLLTRARRKLANLLDEREL